jgi:surface antigen
MKFFNPGVLAASVVLPVFSMFASPAQANSCQCTNYVANRFRLSQNFGHAGDWDNGYLQRNGFVRVDAQPGAIAVMERSFPGADRNYGHVGIVESIVDGRVIIRGANQNKGSAFFGDAGCSNVRLMRFKTPISGRDGQISFWRKR